MRGTREERAGAHSPPLPASNPGRGPKETELARYANILQTIGRTPLVTLHRLAPPGVHVHVKVESFNPLGSVKDRLALAVIEDAERRGALRPGQTVVEATSGNTGIGLAMVCAQKGYPLVLTMAENFSVERRRLLRFLGARVVLTPASEKGSGMLAKAIELARTHGWFLCRQFENVANAEAHRRTTGPEILADMAGERLHAFVSGFGTGGTLLGVSRALKAHDAGIRVVAAEPDNSPVLASGIAQPRSTDGAPNGSHPQFRPHLMQGWAPDFIAPLTESAVREGLVDEIVPVSGHEAIRLSRALATQEGIFAGITSGATLAAALDVARRAPPGSHIVCMLPDTGERYLSTALFEGIGVEMDEAEMALSRSTPGYRFDASPAPSCAAAPMATTPATDVEAEAFVAQAIDSEPVVMFALQWCEFCWAVRKLFDRLGVACRSVDLDSVALQEGLLGTRLRAVLRRRTGASTIPQIWIAGNPIGGATELLEAVREGRLQQLLAAARIPFDVDADIDPADYLPRWLHPRALA
jgi:cysteine synthase A